MIDFDISSIDQVNRRIAEVKGKQSIFNLEWLVVYLEIKESLIAGDLEALFEAKHESLLTQIEILKAHQREGIPEMSSITKEFIQRKFVEIYTFLHSRYTEQKLFAMRGDRGDLFEPATSEEGRAIGEQIAQKEKLIIELLKESFEVSGSSKEEIKAFVERDFFTEDLDPEVVDGILKSVDPGLKDRAREFLEEEHNCYPAMKKLLMDVFALNVEEPNRISE